MLHSASQLSDDNAVGAVSGNGLDIVTQGARDGFIDNSSLVQAQTKLAAMICAPTVHIGVCICCWSLVLLAKAAVLAASFRSCLTAHFARILRNLTSLSDVRSLAYLGLLGYTFAADVATICYWILRNIESRLVVHLVVYLTLRGQRRSWPYCTWRLTRC